VCEQAAWRPAVPRLVDVETWQRPYTPGAGRWVIIGWEALALALLAWSSIETFELAGHGVRLLACGLAAVWVIGTHRILLMGAYVGVDGLRIHGLLRSRTMAWADITQVHLHDASHRIGPFRIPSGLTVLIERRDGSTVNTELWAQGVDFHSRPRLFRAVYHELRARHLAASGG